jgi:predicted nucleic acid-binding protein
LGVVGRNDFDKVLWKSAGKLKAGGKISLADCVAIALTNRVGGTLLSSDHRELDAVAATGICPITFIR